MRPVEDGGVAPDAFTAPLRVGGYGLPQGGAAHGHGHGPDGVSSSVRTAQHRGHEIRIETTYVITIDGKPLQGGLEVLDNGAVHYHGLPQYALPSAIDMCKRVLDYFGTEPPAADDLGCLTGEHGEHCGNGETCCTTAPADTPQQPAGHDHGTHDHGSHDHGTHDHGTHDHGSHQHGGGH